MDITYLGHSSFKLKGKGASIITDPYHATNGQKFPSIGSDIVTISHDHDKHNAAELVKDQPFVVSGPGEYEIKGVKIVGVSSYHDAKQGKEKGKNTIYNIKIDGIRICHLGDIGQSELSSAQMENIGNVHILFTPVGGRYTLDSSTASKIVAEIEPRIVIPMHYSSNELDRNLDTVSKFLKEMGATQTETTTKLSITRDKLPDELSVVVFS